jgi:hypothetical protein
MTERTGKRISLTLFGVGVLALLALTVTGCEAELAVGGAPATGSPIGDGGAPPDTGAESPIDRELEMPRPEANEPFINLSELHYAQTALAGDDHHDADEPVD